MRSFLLFFLLVFFPLTVLATPGSQIHLNNVQDTLSQYDTKDIFQDPTGQRLVYVSNEHDLGIFRLISVGVGGGSWALLDDFPVSVDTNSDPIDPEFHKVQVSPDGKYVVFIASRHRADTEDRLELFSVPIGGGDVIHLTNDTFYGRSHLELHDFKISPDSKKVLFQVLTNVTNVSGPSAVVDLYSMDITGSSVVPLNTSQGISPGGLPKFPIFEFSPVSDRVIYNKRINSSYPLFSKPVSGGTEIEISPSTASTSADVPDMKIPGNTRAGNVVLFRFDDSSEGKYRLYHYDFTSNNLTLVNDASPPKDTDSSEFYDFSDESDYIVYVSDQESLGTYKVSYRKISDWSGAAAVSGVATVVFYKTEDPNFLILVGGVNIYSFDLGSKTNKLLKSYSATTQSLVHYIGKDRIISSYQPTAGTGPHTVESYDFSGNGIKTFGTNFSHQSFLLRTNIHSNYFLYFNFVLGSPTEVTVFRNDNSESFNLHQGSDHISVDRYDARLSNDGQRLFLISDRDDGQTYKLYSQIINTSEFVDEVPPILSLLGNKTEITEQGTSFVDPGATAFDDLDGNISGSITTQGTVNTNQIADYEVEYSVQDSHGNSASDTRIVRVLPFCDGVPVEEGFIPDSDTDGVNDCDDDCPSDPLKISAGECGCGQVDEDVNGDGIIDCNITLAFSADLDSFFKQIKKLKAGKKKKKFKKSIKESLKNLNLFLNYSIITNDSSQDLGSLLNQLNKSVNKAIKFSFGKRLNAKKFKRFKKRSTKLSSKILALVS
ncbi:MAG: DUF5011 domain-containing protein [Bdellovibrionales bacterium]|nr:DUF5011 domain-containing protein [Bdellovibrionales bacterium]